MTTHQDPPDQLAARVLGEIAINLSVTPLKGGSAATVTLYAAPSGDRVVIKSIDKRNKVATDKLRAEVRQLSEQAGTFSRLGVNICVPTVVDVAETTDRYMIALSYVEGVSASQWMRQTSQQAVKRAIGTLCQASIRLAEIGRGSEPSAFLRYKLVERPKNTIAKRPALLALASQELVINGTKCRPLSQLLDSLDPSAVEFPLSLALSGDLNVTNVLIVDSGPVGLVDPLGLMPEIAVEGTMRLASHPALELGGLAIGAVGWWDAFEGRVTVAQETKGVFSISLDPQSRPGRESLLHALSGALSSDPQLERLTFIACMSHLLADSSYRVVGPNETDIPAAHLLGTLAAQILDDKSLKPLKVLANCADPSMGRGANPSIADG